MSNPFDRKDIAYKPNKILADNILSDEVVTYDDSGVAFIDIVQVESEKVIQRLLDHIRVIDDYNKRLDTIDYLTDKANSLSGELEYSTDQKDILDAIKSFGESGNYVTFDLFKKSIDVIIENFKNMQIVSLSGVKPS